MDDRRFWVGFSLVKGIGAVRLQALLNAFGDLESAWNASAFELSGAGLGPKIAERVLLARQQVNLDAYLASVDSAGISILTWNDPQYPARLKQIDQPPPVLYLRGALIAEDDWAVAIVGTRAISPYGRQVTEEIASVLAGNGVTIISGLARGVDAAAHNAALKAGGRTVGVLGSGVDKIYPPEHRALAEKMTSQGAVLSDYAPGTPPDAANFPPRNRIISGLSRAVIVIEAGESSGALITASFAAEQGREVFAVPGSIYAPNSKGPNRLIANGARPLLSPADLLTALDLTSNVERREIRLSLPADPVEAALWNMLGAQALHVDEICARSALPVEKVSAALTMMELKGMVRQVGGMTYVGLREAPGEYNLK
ncbi:MAG: DNA-processing protein DprA [Anaerolineales bacterium]